MACAGGHTWCTDSLLHVDDRRVIASLEGEQRLQPLRMLLGRLTRLLRQRRPARVARGVAGQEPLEARRAVEQELAVRAGHAILQCLAIAVVVDLHVCSV